jgi:ligand-binding sensor domain-containing protein
VLWIGTRNGLYRLDRDRTRFVRYRHDYDDPDSLSSDYISALFEDDEGGMWAGADRGGIVRFSTRPVFRRERAHGDKRDDRADYVASAYQDRQGNIWTGGKGILNRIDRQPGRVTSYNLGGPQGRFANADVLGIVEDGAGKLWLATWGGGIQPRDPNRRMERPCTTARTFQHDSGLRLHLFFDQEGRLWARNQNGLNAFDARTERFQLYAFQVGQQPGARHRANFMVPCGSRPSTTGTPLRPETGRFTVYRHSAWRGASATTLCRPSA